MDKREGCDSSLQMVEGLLARVEEEVDLPRVITKDKLIQVHSPLFINLELKNTRKLSVLVNLVAKSDSNQCEVIYNLYSTKCEYSDASLQK